MAKKQTTNKTASGSVKNAAKPKGSPALARQIMVLNEAIHNVSFSRSTLSRTLNGGQDPRRSIDDECGFPAYGSITPEDYKEMYDRMAIATRVVEVLPRESWQVTPIVQETEDLGVNTPFEVKWKNLPKTLGGPSWHESEDEGGNAVWEYLLRFDMQLGKGEYGVLLFGFNDKKGLEEPVESVVSGKPSTTEMDLNFLTVFDQVNAQIHSYDTSEDSERFGKPEFYNLTEDNPSGTGINKTTATRKVHWSRVLHGTDNIESSEIFSPPRQQPVWNNLLSLRKTLDGSAEMYWKGAAPGISVETDPSLGGDVQIDAEATQDQIEDYQNSLQRYMLLSGATAKSLAPQVVDPSPQVRVQIEAICIRLGIPIRIFMGSERGELASGQDDETWNDRLRVRQSMYITPRIIAPFINRLILAGVLPEPEQYTTKWPDLDSPSDKDQAEIAVLIAQAMAAYADSGAAAIMSELHFFVNVLKIDQKLAEEMLESAVEEERLISVDEEDDANMEGQGNGAGTSQPAT